MMTSPGLGNAPRELSGLRRMRPSERRPRGTGRPGGPLLRAFAVASAGGASRARKGRAAKARTSSAKHCLADAQIAFGLSEPEACKKDADPTSGERITGA